MDVLISQGFLYRLALFMLVAVAYIWGTLGRNRSQERVEIFSWRKYYLPGTEPKCSEANETRRLGGGDFRNGKILPDLYFCDGQAIMSMKLTEGST